MSLDKPRIPRKSDSSGETYQRNSYQRNKEKQGTTLLWEISHEPVPTKGGKFQAEWLKSVVRSTQKNKSNVRSRGPSGPCHGLEPGGTWTERERKQKVGE